MFSNANTLTPRKSSRSWILPLLLVVGSLVVIGLGLYMTIVGNRSELVLVWARPVVAGQQISDEDITTMALPINRPEQLQTLKGSSNIIGMWATRSTGTGELVTAQQLSAEAPTTPYYPNGAKLPENMVALPFSLQSVGPIDDHDTVNISFVDTTGDPQRCSALGGQSAQATALPNTPSADTQGNPLPITCRLLPQVPVLYVDQGDKIAYLAVTPYQSQVVYTLSALETVQLYGERYGTTSSPLPYMTLLTPSSIDADLLTGPVSETTPLLPGMRKGSRPTQQAADR